MSPTKTQIDAASELMTSAFNESSASALLIYPDGRVRPSLQELSLLNATDHCYLTRDETLRDGNQGEVLRGAYVAACHIHRAHSWVDKMTIGWPYSNPADAELANYLRRKIFDGPQEYTKDQFYIYTLMHLGDENSQADVSRSTPFGQMLDDIHRGTNPYGMVNVLSKARVQDLQDFGENFDSRRCVESIGNTMRLLRDADPNLDLELSLEHFFSAWIESESNRPHILNAMVAGLLGGANRILIPDTDGALSPHDIREVIKEATEALQADERLLSAGICFDPWQFNAHMHDDLGLATANTLEALEAGCGSFDVNFGRMGERRGNATVGSIASVLNHPGRSGILKYSQELEDSLGIRPGDKEIGNEGAYNAVGGMHGSRLWKAFLMNLDPERNSDSKYVRTEYFRFLGEYRGSYATVSPADFGQRIEPTLSPMGGASNVQLILAGMGAIFDKTDPRIAKVLDAIKQGEHFRGENYRGFNNGNAQLLVAKTCGLFSLTEDQDKRIENILADVKLDSKPESLLPRLEVFQGRVKVTDSSVIDAEYFQAVRQLFDRVRDENPDLIGSTALVSARYMEIPCGKIVEVRDELAPEKVRDGVRLVFQGFDSHELNIYGTADSPEDAIKDAIRTFLELGYLRAGLNE